MFFLNSDFSFFTFHLLHLRCLRSGFALYMGAGTDLEWIYNGIRTDLL